MNAIEEKEVRVCSKLDLRWCIGVEISVSRDSAA